MWGDSHNGDEVREEGSHIAFVVVTRAKLWYYIRAAEFVPMTNSNAVRTARSVSNGVGEGDFSMSPKILQRGEITSTRGAVASMRARSPLPSLTLNYRLIASACTFSIPGTWLTVRWMPVATCKSHKTLMSNVWNPLSPRNF